MNMRKTSYDEWDIALAEFRGATINSLENIRDELKRLNDNIDDISKSLTTMKLKVAMISATVGILVAIIFNFYGL